MLKTFSACCLSFCHITSTSPWHILMMITYDDFSSSVAEGTNRLRNDDMAMAIPNTLKHYLYVLSVRLFNVENTQRVRMKYAKKNKKTKIIVQKITRCRLYYCAGKPMWYKRFLFQIVYFGPKNDQSRRLLTRRRSPLPLIRVEWKKINKFRLEDFVHNDLV